MSTLKVSPQNYGKPKLLCHQYLRYTCWEFKPATHQAKEAAIYTCNQKITNPESPLQFAKICHCLNSR